MSHAISRNVLQGDRKLDECTKCDTIVCAALLVRMCLVDSPLDFDPKDSYSKL